MAGGRPRLARRRKAMGFSQESLAGRLAVDRSTVVRWERGSTQPLPWLRPKLARLLRVSVEELDSLLGQAGSSVEEADDRLLYSLEHPSSVDLLVVTRLQRQVDGIDACYDRLPSTSLLADAGQCLGQVGFLRAHTASTSVQRALCAVEAEAATLMGQLVWDAFQRRDHATARAYFDQAISAAQQLRDPVAEGAALLRKSFVVMYGEKNPKAGLELTGHTVATIRGSSQALAGLATLHLAEAHAMLRERTACEKALGEATAHFDRVAAGDAALGMYSPNQHGRLAGSCYLYLDDAKRAEEILDATAKALKDRAKSRAIVYGNLALARVRMRELDSAVTALHHAIDIVQETWGGGGLNIIFGAARALRPWRNDSVVREAYDRLLALMAAA